MTSADLAVLRLSRLCAADRRSHAAGRAACHDLAQARDEAYAWIAWRCSLREQVDADAVRNAITGGGLLIL